MLMEMIGYSFLTIVMIIVTINLIKKLIEHDYKTKEDKESY